MGTLSVLLHFISISIVFFIFSGTSLAATSYSFTQLKDSPTAARSGNNVIDIDPTGLVVGQAFSSDFDNHAAIWFNTENPTDLTPFFDFSDSVARAINSHQEVVISKNNGSSFLWIDGVETDIVSPTSARVYATDINDVTQIVGSLGNSRPSAGGNERAFIWENGVMTDLGTLPNGGGSVANAINNLGQVVGSAFDVNGDERAVLWDEGIIVDLGSLSGDVGSEASSINDEGVVVGVSFTTKVVTVGSTVYTVRDIARAFIWSNDVMTELGGPGSSANDINNVGQIVGTTMIAGVRHAVVWDTSLVLNDLNPFLNSVNCFGNALNDNGQIIGSCINADRVSLSFRLTPSGTMPPPPPPPENSEADLEVEISASAGKIKRGEKLEYTIVVTNNGPDTAEEVSLTNKLPSNVKFISVNGTGCSGTTTIICQLADLSSGASETVFLTVSPFKGRRVNNSVSAISATEDPDTDNNTDSVKVRVRR